MNEKVINCGCGCTIKETIEKNPFVNRVQLERYELKGAYIIREKPVMMFVVHRCDKWMNAFPLTR